MAHNRVVDGTGDDDDDTKAKMLKMKKKNSEQVEEEEDVSSMYDNKTCPFINDVLENLTLCQKLKIIIASVTLAPIRLVFVVLSLIVLWIVGSLLNIGLDTKFKTPISGLRK